MGGGKSGTTTQTVSIPPEVLARYNSVNARAEQVASQPFQAYQGQFVAPLTETQQQGIQQTTAASQAAQPYYQAASQQLINAQQAAQPAIGAAYQSLGSASDVGANLAQTALQQYSGAQQAAQPYYGAASQGIGRALNVAQPYQMGSTGLAMAGAQSVNPQDLNINKFMSPYTQSVADTTFQALRQQQAQEMQGATANAIRSGAFGGDRAGLVAANLARQQQLGTAQAMMPIYQQAYNQALQTAQQQQGVDLSAQQSNRAALQQAAQQLASIGQQGFGQQLSAAQQQAGIGKDIYSMGIGTGQSLAGLGQQQFGQGATTAQQLAALGQQQYGMGASTAQNLAQLGSGAQQAALQGAQAQLGAGTLEQQTQQADTTARYQQFLQERGYPFQVAQFLANIAMGTGALSGSTTTTTQPMPFFSDIRLKENVEPIGKTFDGQNIYKYNYKGEPGTQIGLMAQEVEHKKPEAVGLASGFKTVDYDKATEDAAELAHDNPKEHRGHYAPGGLVDPSDLSAILAAQKQAFGPFAQHGLYGSDTNQGPYGGKSGIVPSANLPVGRLMTAGSAPAPRQSGLGQAFSDVEKVTGLYDRAKPLLEKAKNVVNQDVKPDAPATAEKIIENQNDIKNPLDDIEQVRSMGGVVPGFAKGGTAPINPYNDKDPFSYFPDEALDVKEAPELSKPGQPPSSQSGGSGIGSAIGAASSLIGIGSKVLPFIAGLFSDERLKHNIEPVGKTFDGQNIYKYDFGDGRTQIGLMAQEVLNKRPQAVGEKDGFLTVDYDEAIKSPRERDNLQDGGVPSELDIERAKLAIAKNESGGNYEALGPDVRGDRAYGKYQVMGKNIPSWTEEAIGQRMSPQDFLRNPDAQERVFEHHFGKAYSKYGTPQDAASVWFSGRPMAKAGNAADVLGTTVPSYVSKFMSTYSNSGKDIAPENAQYASGIVPSLGKKPNSDEAGLSAKLAEYLPSKRDEKGQQSVDWKKTLVPLLSGLGTMAQSRSPFLGAAILEGLGGGAQAYANLEQQQQGIAESAGRERVSQVQAEKILSSIPRDALITDQSGRTLGVRVYVNGEATMVPISEYYKAQREGRPYKLTPVVGGVSGAPVEKNLSTQLPIKTVEEQPSFKVPVSQVEQKPIAEIKQPVEEAFSDKKESQKITPYQNIDDELKKIAEKNAKGVQETGFAVLEKSPEANPFDAQAVVAAEANKNRQQRLMLARSLGEIPREGLVSANEFSAKVATPVVQYVNGLLNTIGADFRINKAEDLANAEIARKISTQLASRQTNESGQRAYGALEEIMKAIPSQMNTPQGAGALVADIMMIGQREQDIDRYLRKMREHAEKETGVNVNESRYIGRGLVDEYLKRMDSTYTKEKENLKKMYLQPLEYKDKDTGQTVKTYLMPFIIQNGGKLPKKLEDAVKEKYGEDILRYFRG